MRNEDGDRVADEHVASLNVVPEEVPDICLGRAGFGNQITADLNVRAVENRAVGCNLLDQGNEARHLRVIDLDLLVSMATNRRQVNTHNHDIGAAILRRAEGPTRGEPVPIGIVGNPVDDGLLLFRGDALIGVADTLKNVVDVLGDSEDAGSRLRHYSTQISNSLPRKDRIQYHVPYQVKSTPMRREKRTRAWRMSATPPPWGVELKKATFVLAPRSFLA